MSKPIHDNCPTCSRTNRRAFLADAGMGLTGLVLASMMQGDKASATESQPWAPPDGKPHFAPKAKRVIWIFMIGGVSHVESFDPKPEINKYADKSIAETPYKDVLISPLVKDNVQEIVVGRKIMSNLFAMQTGFRKRGQSGIEVADWWPHVGDCVDDISVVRSMWTTDNDHGAQLQFHTGRHIFFGYLPTMGSWVHYGLGSLNDNLPSFIVLGQPPADCCGGDGTHGSGYLGPEHAGIGIETDPENPLPFASPGPDMYRQEQKREFEFLRSVHLTSRHRSAGVDDSG